MSFNLLHLSSQLLFLFCILSLVTTDNKDPCGIQPKELCGLSPLLNHPSIPIFQGKCCYGKTSEEQTEESCHFVDNLNYDKIVTQGLTCNTQVEICAKNVPANINDEGACRYQFVETPYSCCFVKYRYQAFCLPLDLSDKKIFKETQYKLRTYYGWEDGGQIEIICGGMMNKVGKIVLMVVMFFLF